MVICPGRASQDLKPRCMGVLDRGVRMRLSRGCVCKVQMILPWKSAGHRVGQSVKGEKKRLKADQSPQKLLPFCEHRPR
jgi:hypothetical protein